MIRSVVLMGLAMFGNSEGALEAPKPAMELTGRVVDRANLIDDRLESQLTARLARLQRETRVQMVVATTPSLDGQSIDNYSLRLANSWGVGSRERNDGLVLLVAPNERKMRIEVGKGLESVMTDDLCADVIQRSIIPRFRKGDMAGGIMAGIDAILPVLKAKPALRDAA
ncbi:TPM domain-containing protein [Sphingobium sp. YR768]|uniref:TPM domain-containing protein n=1 Tax=Sphingobium sp. YR768 TaxID=1884365 RepID=UPI0008CFB22E|nr:TPM domain-containing protein [Sphingobium sp. YR768]SEQ93910.1 TLP18.3, Psb32 and MOLO-1 founding protein of phosphatase [Sphingobium sp. YR768]